jgi:hypothetical protein
VHTCRQSNTETFHFGLSEHRLTLAGSMPVIFALCHDNISIPTTSLNEMKVSAKCKTLNLSTDGRIFIFIMIMVINNVLQLVKHC